MKYEKDFVQLGRTIVEERKKHGYKNQPSFIEKLKEKGFKIARNRLSDFENGEIKDSSDLALLRACTEIFNCDYGYLFGEIVAPKQSTEYICNETGLTPQAVTAIQSLNEMNESRAYIDLLSCLLCSENLTYFLGLLEAYLTDNRPIEFDTNSMVKVEIQSKDATLFSASHILGNMLDEVSDLFAQVQSTKQKTDTLFEKKIKEMEESNNGKEER